MENLSQVPDEVSESFRLTYKVNLMPNTPSFLEMFFFFSSMENLLAIGDVTETLPFF